MPSTSNADVMDPATIVMKLLDTFVTSSNVDDLPARPPSAPSNIETISLWGARYPGQKLYPDTPPFMTIDEYYPVRATEPEAPVEPDDPEIWNRVVTLCDMLRAFIERLPDPVEEPSTNGGNPNGPITSSQLLKTSESFIEALIPVRPLLPNKLTESALERNPELKQYVHSLEHRFDDIERVLHCIPQIYEEVTKEECDAAMLEVEAIMACLGIGWGSE